jgi:hypothetical protein
MVITWDIVQVVTRTLCECYLQLDKVAISAVLSADKHPCFSLLLTLISNMMQTTAMNRTVYDTRRRRMARRGFSTSWRSILALMILNFKQQ